MSRADYTGDWADLNKCSPDTANRDIQDLVKKGILREDFPGAKRPSYSICYGGQRFQLASLLSEISIVEEDNNSYLITTYKGIPIRERILRLDAERFNRGDLPLEHLIDKYLSYIVCQ